MINACCFLKMFNVFLKMLLYLNGNVVCTDILNFTISIHLNDTNNIHAKLICNISNLNLN